MLNIGTPVPYTSALGVVPILLMNPWLPQHVAETLWTRNDFTWESGLEPYRLPSAAVTEALARTGNDLVATALAAQVTDAALLHELVRTGRPAVLEGASCNPYLQQRSESLVGPDFADARAGQRARACDPGGDHGPIARELVEGGQSEFLAAALTGSIALGSDMVAAITSSLTRLRRPVLDAHAAYATRAAVLDLLGPSPQRSEIVRTAVESGALIDRGLLAALDQESTNSSALTADTRWDAAAAMIARLTGRSWAPPPTEVKSRPVAKGQRRRGTVAQLGSSDEVELLAALGMSEAATRLGATIASPGDVVDLSGADAETWLDWACGAFTVAPTREELIQAAWDLPAKRVAELVVVLRRRPGDVNRFSMLVPHLPGMLAEQLGRPAVLEVSEHLASTLGHDPARWEAAATLLESGWEGTLTELTSFICNAHRG